MDFRLTEAQEAFRKEIQEFLDAELTPEFEESFGIHEERFSREFARKLGAKGWLALSWPQEYGGLGRSHLDQLIFNEEMAYRGAPMRAHLFGTAMVGPSIMLFGNEAQKKEFLGKITRGEIVWCQGFSEPEAGSDLASLRLRAVEHGDEFILNGQKIWTSDAHRADYCWLGARTDPDVPKHKGLSTFIVDMKTPGITVRPLMCLADVHHFNEVFFDDVRIPKSCLVGEKNRGWYQMAATLDFERSGIATFAVMRRTVEELVEFVKGAKRNGEPPALDRWLRHRLAEMAIEIEAGRLMAYRVGFLQSQGKIPNYEASMSKFYGASLTQRLAQVGVQMAGLYGQLKEGSQWVPLKGKIEHSYLWNVASTIRGGTNEVQLNIIAQRGLGLPR